LHDQCIVNDLDHGRQHNKWKEGVARIMAAMITTEDNPFDPREDFPSWYAWDVEKGYNTCAYLARVAVVTVDFPEVLREQQIEAAIDEIIEIHAGGLYKKLLVQSAA